MIKTESIKKLCHAARTVIIILLIILTGINLISLFSRLVLRQTTPSFFGYSYAVVASGSMSGTLEIGDIILFRKEASYQEGDTISFTDRNDQLITHRIIEKTYTGYITKGDANMLEDREIVLTDAIEGKVVKVIPKLGSYIQLLFQPVILFLLGLACITLLVIKKSPHTSHTHLFREV